MAYAKVPDFIPRLRERESYSRLALEFAILTQPDARDPELLAKLDAVAGRML